MSSVPDPSAELPPVVYLDHAATSWPKPPQVAEEVARAVREVGGNPGRGAHRLAVDAARAVHDARREVAGFLGVEDSRNLLFQPGCTQALNLVLFGTLRAGDRVVTGPTEHNAVARPLNLLHRRGVEVVAAPVDSAGRIDLVGVETLLSATKTCALVFQHASNVTGAVQPAAELVQIAHGHGARAFVDGAQAGGHLGVDLGALGADAWACSGHKALLGPEGIGLLYLAPEFDPKPPLVLGGTGGVAARDEIAPSERPDRYEAGTPNVPGILGLAAGVRELAPRADEQRELEASLARRLHEGVLRLGGYRVLGPAPDEPRVPIVTVVHERISADRLASALDREYGIAVRAGLHCAPWAHRELGTLETGAVRFSFGWGNTPTQVDLALAGLDELGRELP